MEEKLKKSSGITLIALIITIIVMLILVAVTINLATDGGLFTKSRKATRDTEEQAIYDQIVSAMELKDDGKINPSNTFESFKNEFKSYTITEKEGNTTSKIVFTVRGARDTYTYTITEDEIIIGEKEETPPAQGETKYKIEFKQTIEDVDFTSERANFIILKTENGKLISIEFDGTKLLVRGLSEEPYEFNDGKWRNGVPEISDNVIILDSYQKAKEIDAEFIADQAESDYGIEKELLNKIITLTKVE